MGWFGNRKRILAGRHLAWREEAETLLARLSTALDTFGTDVMPEGVRWRTEADSDLSELFLLVVVGEFNAGKSALINALIGMRVLAEGVTPTTDRIHVLKHGASEEHRRIGDFVRESTHPVELLRDLSFVDTPGTNAIIQQHEELTRKFIPRSDLILFVTSADRPFTATERAFLDLIRRWGKKTVIVVNKVDILEPEDVQEVEAFVRKNATELLGVSPRIFAVSARDGLEARSLGDEKGWKASGMDRLLDYLEGTLDATERVRLKLLNPIGVGLHLAEIHLDATRKRLEVLQEDWKTLQVLNGQLSIHQKTMSQRLGEQLRPIESVFEELEQRGTAFFDREIRLSNFRRLLSPKDLGARFSTEVVGDLERRIDGGIQPVIDWMIDEHLNLWQDVSHFLEERRLNRHRGKMVGEGRPHFEYNRQALIDTVGRAADRAVAQYDRDAEAAQIAQDVKDMMAATAMVEVGAVGLGTLLVSLLTTAAADVTGVLLATVVATSGFYIIPSRRRRAKGAFKRQVDELRKGLIETLTRQLEEETKAVVGRVEKTISPFSRFVQYEVERLENIREELSSIERALSLLKREIEGT